MNRYWFKPRRYGLGATPSSWEGWVSLPIFVLMIVLATVVFPPERRPLPFAFAEAALVGMYIWLVWIKTDGAWRWRWGEDD